jgi:transcriptional antiterminator RfaH
MAWGWVVLKTQPQREVLAAEAVRARGGESFVPYLPARRRDGRAVPLFPGYLFARVASAEDLLPIRSAPGVAYVLPRAAGAPALVPELVVDALRGRTAYPTLRHGDHVVIEDGPFRWMEAVFDRQLSAAGRVRILLALVNRTVALQVDEQLLKRVGA